MQFNYSKLSTRLFLPIHPRNSNLQHGRDTDPCEIRDVGEGYPFDMRIYGNQCPNECGEDEKDIDGRKQVVFEAKLKIGEREIENEVEGKRQSNHCREFFCVDFVKYRAIGNGNNGVQHCPHRPKDPSRWRPCGLEKCAIPVVGV